MRVKCKDSERKQERKCVLSDSFIVMFTIWYENFVAEAFVKQGLGLYYYKKENATLEEDFFVRTKDELVPVEVKANRNRSKSLRQLISSDSYSDIHWGIKLADSNVGIEDGIYTFPYFCTFLLKRYLKEKRTWNKSAGQ